MDNTIYQINGRYYRHVEMTHKKFSERVKKFASTNLERRHFNIFMSLNAHERYDELIEYNYLYHELLDCGVRTDDICDYIEDTYSIIGEIIEPIDMDD